MTKIICYIDSMQIGGAQRVMSNLAKHFIDSNINVILVNDIVPVDGVPEYKIDNRVKRVFLDKKKMKTNRLRKNIYRVSTIRKLVKKETPDVVLSFIGPPNIRMLLGTLGLKTRKIVSVRNDPYKEYGSGMKKEVAKVVFNLADGCVFQTKAAADYFSIKLQRKSTVIFNPVEEIFYKTNHNSDEKTIIMVGRLNHQKNYSMAIKAFSLVAERHPEVVLDIYGEGELRESIQKEIDKANLNSRVFLKGRTDAVYDKLSSAMIFMMTSEFEGLPNALMEALAMGLPCISTDCSCGGPKSIVIDGKNGYLVECNNEVQLAQKLDMLISNRIIRESMSREAKKIAQDFFPDLVYKKWDEFLFQQN